MKQNAIKTKSFGFAIRIVRLYQELVGAREYVLSKQLLRSGTSVGAMVHEAEHAESRADFNHKISIAQKEINETIYWLELLKETGYLTADKFQPIHTDAREIIRLLTSIIKTTQANINH